VKFLYKIWSGYDGFTPAQLPSRREASGLLRLNWRRYAEAVDSGSDVWVYFSGQHAFTNGVYIKGVVQSVDVDAGEVLLRMHQFSSDQPLTDTATNARIAELVKARGLQVFVLPEVLDGVPACNVATTASTCGRRDCGGCPTWKSLPLVQPRNLGHPQRLPGDLDGFVPAYWVIPPRNFIYRSGERLKTEYGRTNELFRRFKTGEKKLAFPLALAMHEALSTRGFSGLDAIVPVPLSPDKAQRDEIHRTLLLARELARLLGVPVREALSLSAPISKRRLRGDQGLSPAQFEHAYRQYLVVDPAISQASRILLVDDVCTAGSTIRASAQALRAVNPGISIIAVTAGQMTVRAAVEHEEDLIAASKHLDGRAPPLPPTA
jgi:hypothetical protein